MGAEIDSAETVLVSAGLALDLDDAYISQGGTSAAAQAPVPLLS